MAKTSPLPSFNRIDELKWAASMGFPEAQWALGLMFEDGFGVDQDLELACSSYQKAANQGLVVAKFDLARLRLSIEAPDTDSEEAIKLCCEAAEADLPAAQYLLGLYFLFQVSAQGGEDADALLEKSVTWLQKAASNGVADAAFRLASLYERSEQKDPSRFLSWLERAHSLGSAGAALGLARAYWEGGYVKKDEARAIELFNVAADRGSAGACLFLAQAYRSGSGFLSTDETAAARFLQRYSEIRSREKGP